jgi:SAM-dependent methyltransferase
MTSDITTFREKFWGDKKGESYYQDYGHVTNNRRWLAQIIASYHPKSVVELGCNVGSNLRAIHEIDPSIKLAGLDIDATAIEKAKATLPGEFVAGSIYDAASLFNRQFDLVFTCGTLIHIPPESLAKAVEQVKALGKTVVLLEDHGAPQVRKLESGVPARWVHDYKKFFPEAKVLRPVDRWSDGWNHLIVMSTPSLWLFYVRPFFNGAVRKIERTVGYKRKRI